MRNEWSSNIWMIVELFIVSVVLWFIFATLAMYYSMYKVDKGWDSHDICLASTNVVPQDSPHYHPYDSTSTPRTDLQLLVNNLRNNEYVEAVGLGQNALPYNYNYYGTSMGLVTPDTTFMYYANRRMMSPDMFKVFRIEGANGETPEQLAEILERDQVIISGYELFDENLSDPDRFIGQQVFIGDTASVFYVATKAYGMRRSDYEPLRGGVVYTPLGGIWPRELAVRVKPGMSEKFLQSLTHDDKQVGNVYINNLRTIEAERENAHYDINVSIRNFIICASFLLLVIFLSFLGTFWFRTQERTSEIAIRITNGATRRDIFARFVGEGLGLLVIATVAAAIVDILLIKYDTLPIEITSLTYYVIPFVFILLSAMTVAAIWTPASKAMKIDPASALKDQ